MKKIYSLLVLFSITLAYAQNPADLDPGFNNAPIALNQYYNEATVLKIQAQADGKLLILSNTLVRIDENGVDHTFTTAFELNSTLNDFSIQPDGKIVVVGNFLSYAGISRKYIVRLNADGSIDNTFEPVGNSFYVTSSTVPKQVVALPDGKMLVFGPIPSYNNVTINGMACLNSDGTLDTGFVNTYNFATANSKFFVQPDGKILALSNANGGATFNRLARYNSNGSYDTSFVQGNISTSETILAIAIQNDGKIILGGRFNSYATSSADNIVRLEANGTVDPTFDVSTGFVNLARLRSLLVQPDGKIIAAGDFDSYNGIASKGIVKLNSDGSKDATFESANGFGFESTVVNVGVNALVWQPGDKLIAGGSMNFYGGFPIGRIVRINSDGSRDETFTNIRKGFDGQVNASALQPDGKILTAGNFERYTGIPTQKLVRLHADGSHDATFNLPALGFSENATAPIGPYNNPVKTIMVQPDGKILVGGDFIFFDGQSQRGLVRLNSDGSKDATFNIGTGFTSSAVLYGVKKILLQPDGKIIIFGDFDSYNSQSCPNIIRLNADGSLDTTFTSSLVVPTAAISDVYLQPDGKLLIGGNFQSTINGTFVTALVRLNSSGSLDNTFTSGIGAIVSNICTQADGKILVKVVQTWNSSAKIHRLNASGSVDNSFTYPPSSSPHNVFNFILLPDGKILNNYTSSSGFTKLERLNTNGSVDSSFDTGTILSGSAFNLLLQPDGKVVATGNFRTYNGLPALRILRILNEHYYFITGTNRFDSNGNGCESSDPVFPNLNFQVSSTTNNFSYITNTSGGYSIPVAAGDYTLTPVFENPSYFSITPSSLTVSFPSQLSPMTQNFCISPIGNHPDLEVTILPLNAARPGFDSHYKIVYKNKGNQIQSGTVTLSYDDLVTDLVLSIPSFTTQAANTLNWNFTNMQPLETREIVVTLNLNSPTETPALNAGSVLDFTAEIISSLTDETPEDNNVTLHQTVVNSFDPNDKTCLEGTQIAIDQVGDYVHYMIRFENTGTFTAQNVNIVDLIDTSKFDINSLRPINGSHPFVTKISEGNKVEFFFKDINLPFDDATNDGYVAFKIRTLSSLQHGDSFSNSVSIYFDYNYPIDTELATTYIQTLSIQEFESKQYVTIYPNPTRGLLHISREEDITISSIAIYNTLGQLVMTMPNLQNVSSIEVSGLQSGNYFIQFYSNKGIVTSKFIKF